MPSDPRTLVPPQVQAVAPDPSTPTWRAYVEMAQSIVCALAIAVVLRTLLFQPFTIPSSSMEPSLVTGDYILVSKFAYGWSRASLPFNPPLPNGVSGGRFGGPFAVSGPKRGDVVVFRLPRDPQQAWIKRVIGLPGDRVQVVGGRVLLNGQPLSRTILGTAQDHDAPWRAVLEVREAEPNGRSQVIYSGAPDHEGDDTGVYVVPAGSYFVMGDNRDNSLDSRYPREVGVGFLPAENIIGKAELVLVSWKPGFALAKPWTWLRPQLDRFFHPIR
jgi:signal peptidase I